MFLCDVAMSIVYWAIVSTIAILIIQCVRFVFADADLTLLFKMKVGKKPTCLAGEVVWITGASGGIGEHLAYELVRAGCRLILSARRTEELEQVKKQCLLTAKVREEDVYILPIDMLKLDTHQQAVEQALQRFNKIDILVNNAGRSQRSLLKDTNLEVDQALMALNYTGVLSLTKAVLPHMLENKQGHLVITSSVAGKLGVPMSSGYSASKFALHGWFETARVELAASNIDITMVCPGPVFSRVQAEAYTETTDKVYGIDMQQNERRMSTERCAELMAVAIANRLDEVWISLQPVLLVTYLAQYMPDIAKMLAKHLGKNNTMLQQLRRSGPTVSSN